MDILNFEKRLKNKKLKFAKSLLKKEGFKWGFIQTISEDDLMTYYATILKKENLKNLDKFKE